MNTVSNIFKCDRCSEELLVEFASDLNDDGWRRVVIGSYSGDRILSLRDDEIISMPVARDLCRVCYAGLVAYIEMEQLLDYVSHSNET